MSGPSDQAVEAARAAMNKGRDGKRAATIGDSWFVPALEAAYPIIIAERDARIALTLRLVYGAEVADWFEQWSKENQ